MTNQTRNQKGSSQLFVIVLAVAVIAALALFLFSQGKPVTQQQTAQNVPAINSPSDLNATSTDLDNTDMTQFDKDLNQLSTDASAF